MTLLTVATVTTGQCTVKTVHVIAAPFYMKQTHRNIRVQVQADVEDNTSIFFSEGTGIKHISDTRLCYKLFTHSMQNHLWYLKKDIIVSIFWILYCSIYNIIEPQKGWY